MEKVVEVMVQKKDVVTVDQCVDRIVEVVKTNVVKQVEYVCEERAVEVPTVKEVIVPQKETVREQVPVQQII